MDTQTGEIQSIEDWKERLGEEETEKRVESGRLIRGEMGELNRKAKLIKLKNGTKSQRKKYRQLTSKKREKKR